jgi:hypothetical protein
MWQRIRQEWKEQVWDNEQVLKLRQKFAELDTQTQSYVLIGSFAGFVVVLLLTFFVLWGRAISVKNEIAAMEETIQYVQKSAVKIEELKAQAMQQGTEPLLEGLNLDAGVTAFLEQAVQKSLISKANVEIVAGQGSTAEAKLNKISLTQLVRMLYILEKAGAGTIVEKVSVDAKEDKEGYLWASLLVRKGK